MTYQLNESGHASFFHATLNACYLLLPAEAGYITVNRGLMPKGLKPADL